MYRPTWSRIVAVAAFLLMGAGTMQAQLAQNGSTTSAVTFTNVALAQTVAHTTPALANRLILVSVHMNVNLSAGTTIASVTYGGSPLTFARGLTDAGNDVRAELWYRIAPATGSNSVVVTAQNVTANVPAVIGITTYVDVDQALTGTLGYTTTNTSNNPSTTLAGLTAGDLVVDFLSARQNAATTVTAAVNQTQIYNANSPGAGTGALRTAASRAVAAGANVTMSYNLSAAVRWIALGTSMRAARTDVEIIGYATPDLVDGSPTTVTYTFTITAHSAGANNINFSDALPAGMTIVSATPSQGTCTPAATTTCSIGALLNAGSTATITLVATTTTGSVATVYNNTGTISIGTTDAIAGNNSATVTVRSQSHLCANPGRDGAGGTITGAVNTYFPGNANAAAGATSITLIAGTGPTAIASGDLLLVIQMQDAAIDSNNDDRYGDGAGTGGNGTAGSGSSALNNAGRYEYVVATGPVSGTNTVPV
ncbi:MAG: hypothetical protein ABI837_15165, partial [Acidobacteriota bacterium]